MKTKTFFIIILPILVCALLVATWYLNQYFTDLPNHISQHETIVVGQSRFVPGSKAAVRVVVRDSRDASPLAGAAIRVAMQPAEGGLAVELFKGVTDEQGTADVSFVVPDEVVPNQVLIIDTDSALGSDSIQRPVTIDRDYRVLITTDKPLYQPGQEIHLRLLALSAFDLKPAVGQELQVVISDGKGNKVFRQSLLTSEYGVASTDFELANEVNTGAYKISASMGNTSSEKTINVEHYVLPKFAVELTTERPFYLPGEHVRGTLSADYFFGKPVAGGIVILEGYTFDVERVDVVRIEGTTDGEGDFKFAFDMPAYIAGTELEDGAGRFYLMATVTDQAQHSETSNISLPVTQSSLVIEAIPEGGQFRPGVENILYILTSHPDGTPAECSLNITFYDNNQVIPVESGSYGLAEVHLTPQSPYQQFLVEATDMVGNKASREFYFEGQWYDETVLLRPDRPVYRVGETMNLTILTSASGGMVYLDIVREGQTVSTRSVVMVDGHAEAAIDLSPDLYGTLELHAYKILSWGGITRDTRLVVVDRAEDLGLTLTPGAETYRPGDTAGVDIQVTGSDGQGVSSAVGLAIVDESVFALAEQDPGFAKLYFLLEQELLQPKYDLHGFSVPDLVSGLPISAEPTVRAIEDAAQASLAAATPQMVSFGLEANSHEEAMQNAYNQQQKFYGTQSKLLYGLALLTPLTLIGLCLTGIWHEKRLGRSIGLAFVLIGFLILLFIDWPLGEEYWYLQTPLDRLGVIVDRLMYGGVGILLFLTLGGLAGYLMLIVAAIRRKDRVLGWMLVLAPVFLILVGLLIYSTARGNVYPSNMVLMLGLLAFFLAPFAFFLRFCSYSLGRQAFPALGALLVSGFMILGIFPVLVGGRTMNMAAFAPGMVGDVVVKEELIMREAALPSLAATQAPAAQSAEDGAAKGTGSNSATSSVEPPRLRQYFPETMLWLPDAVTDENGYLHMDFPVADSITTWRMTALASTQDGRLGSATTGLRVFQDFFIDLDLPLALTVGDEVSIPVGVFNYLSESQTVKLELAQADWFELLDEPEKEIEIAGNDINVVYFRVRASQFGMQPFKVTAWGSKMSDAIQKEVHVYPDGKQIGFTQSDRLSPDLPISRVVDIPVDAIPGTQSLVVKIYPGVVSQVVEGLDSILRMPYGCFEQTSSTTYPNVLVLDYLQTTNQAAPEAQMKAEEYINLGYQRLTTFEVGSTGGFSLFGDAPADRMLTAYGLQEFADMSHVQNVDEALVKRAADWLLSQQASDGSWENDRGLVHESTWSSLGNDRLPVTAYIAWSLVVAGYKDQDGTQRGIAYVREHQAEAEDAYVLALVANALVASDLSEKGYIDPSTQAVLDHLSDMARQEGNGVSWTSSVASFMGGEGHTGSIETTALATLAFLRADSHPELANAALTYLIQQKDGFGTWYTTQATVLVLKALIESVRAGGEDVNAIVTVSLNGGQTHTVQVSAENYDVVQLLSFEDISIGRDNMVEISMEGKGNLMYQVSGGYYLPWNKLVDYQDVVSEKELVDIDVAYDRTELEVNDIVNVNITVSLQEGRADSALIDLGLPPGFTVQNEDLEALVAYYNDVPEDYAFPTIQRYELTGRQILIYISNLSAGKPLQFSYRLLAKFPLVAQTPASNAYDYYNPEVEGEALPLTLVVKP